MKLGISSAQQRMRCMCAIDVLIYSLPTNIVKGSLELRIRLSVCLPNTYECELVRSCVHAFRSVNAYDDCGVSSVLMFFIKTLIILIFSVFFELYLRSIAAAMDHHGSLLSHKWRSKKSPIAPFKSGPIRYVAGKCNFAAISGAKLLLQRCCGAIGVAILRNFRVRTFSHCFCHIFVPIRSCV